MPASSSGEPAVEVIVQLHGLAATTGAAIALRTVEEQTQLTLKRLHPGTPDPELAKFASTRVARSSAASVVDLLLRCAEVDAAYVKSDDALP
jgi:hypothetical protein